MIKIPIIINKGTIPIELGNLTNLIYLYLNTNQLRVKLLFKNYLLIFIYIYIYQGSIPSELGKLTNLKSMVLASNRLSVRLTDINLLNFNERYFRGIFQI